ncbi:MAG: hypothetical protein MUC59_01380 [Saprospiraceae bacterium]|jgi:TolA-binding protein|nr:hypothetical protein [Saprospiraceae bacterium]
MKKFVHTVVFGFFAAVLLTLAACREGGAEQSTADETPMQEAVQTIEEAAAAPIDTLANELDEAANEIEQEAQELESALDSL